MKKIVFALVALIVVSCSKEEPLTINVQAKVDKVGTTTANIKISMISTQSKIRVLYKPFNSNESYKFVEYTSGFTILLTSLSKATKYEAVFETYDDKSTLKANTFYFTTKALDFDYYKFYSDNSRYYNTIEIISHTGKNHVIHAPGLSDYNDVKTYLVNEAKTDSILLPSVIVADSLSFTIPDNYVSNNPREALKRSIVGVKIKDSYQYILNSSSKYDNDNINTVPLKFKIYNSKPWINSIVLGKPDNRDCPNIVQIQFAGDFLPELNLANWIKPVKAQLVLFDGNSNFYNSYDFDYSGKTTNSTTCSQFWVSYFPDENYYAIKYHERNVAYCNTLLATGSYKAKIIFTFADGKKVETNLATFTKI
jgi:hypothetical protein